MPLPPEQSAIKLPANCNLAAAQDLLPSLRKGPATNVDASEVSELGQAVLQLLIAAKRDAAAAEREFVIGGASEAFVEHIELCGLTDALELQEKRD